MSILKLGIIGSNFVADWLCDAVTLSEGIVNHAIYSRTAERGNEFAAKHSIPHVYTDLEAFLSSDIDAVYLASPNALHAPQAIAAMNHGKHVLVEKPAALSAAEFDRMCECARDNGVVLLEAMRPAHDPAMQTIRGAMAKVGTIRRATLEFCQYSSRYDRFRAGEILNAFNPSLGNAAVMDIGVYALNVCITLFGAPKEVLSRSVLLPNGMEGMGTAFLDYGSMQAEVVYSKITDSVTPSVITGEDGSLKIGKLSTLDSLSLCLRGQEPEILFQNREKDSNMVYEIADFVNMIHGKVSPDADQNITRETLRVIDEIRRQNGIVFPGCEANRPAQV
ncbi:MAG: Gfo/Idh/MocA family protein [Eubacteriales bacterium]